MGFSTPTHVVTQPCPTQHLLVAAGQTVDPSSTGRVPFRAFERAMVAKLGGQEPREEMLKAFALFTGGKGDSSGRITLADLKRVARELGESLTDEELLEMIEEADRGGDGEGGTPPGVSFHDFAALMKKTNLF